MATVTRENIGLLNDKITVKISKSDYYPSFEKAIKNYSKTANIPGFRKGMVPSGMIKKMHGQSIFADEVMRNVEKELNAYMQTEKLDIFAQPLPLEYQFGKLDMNHADDYEFSFEVGLKPSFEMADLSTAKVDRHIVEVTEEMVDEELNKIQIKSGNMTTPEVVDNEENVLNVTFNECDQDGNIIEGGISKDNSLLLKYFSPAIQKELKGKKVDDSVVTQLSQSFDNEKLEWVLSDLGLSKDDQEAANKFFKIQITKIGLVEKKELNEDFFNEIYPGKEIKTLEEFKESLKKEIEAYWAQQSTNQVHDQIYHFLIDNTNMDFPDAFLKRWLQVGTEKKKSVEEVEKEFPTFINQLRWTLISDKMIKDNDIEVTLDDIKNYAKGQMLSYMGMGASEESAPWLDSYIDRMIKDEKYVENTYRQLITEKLFKASEQKITSKDKKISVDEFVKLQHDHQH